VFMARRAAHKKFMPDVLELPGGHIDYGEDIVAGLRREFREEFHGRDITVGDPFAVFTYTNEVKGSHSIEVVYFARFTDGAAEVQLDPDNHSEYMWLAESDIAQLPAGDEETIAITKGFALLRGEPPVA
jgi:8-oxo-dGTP diphosphatase